MNNFDTSIWKKYFCLIFFFYSVSLLGNTFLNLEDKLRNEGLSLLACPELQVDISTACLQHCTDNQYFINYCNIGEMPVEGAIIQIELDAFLTVNATSIPIVSQIGDILTFDIGDLDVGDCGIFELTAFLSCDAVVGQAHCVEAQIFPDSLCTAPAPDWDESFIEVDFNCNGDSIFFEIINTGNGDMSSPSQFYIIIDDVIVYLDAFQLQSGESTLIGAPTNGGTFYFHAMQSPGYPENNFPSLAVENCQLGSSFNTGFLPQYPENDYNPSFEINCQQSIENCEFNNKIAYPSGFGINHEINANQPIEYQINFQNTSNVTLSDLIICDTLSPFLDPTTFLAGASSHDYQVEILSGNIVKFTFTNIDLPDNLSNYGESFGFIKFTIGQISDNPPGTVILNDAILVFDNDTLLTNEVFHTIAAPIITTIAIEACEEYDYFGTTIMTDTVFMDIVEFNLFNSILVTQINISQPVNSIVSMVICEGEVFEIDGHFFEVEGIYIIEVENPNGCTDQTTLELVVIPHEETTIIAQICEGQFYFFGGEAIFESGFYYFMDYTIDGCMILEELELVVLPPETIFYEETICEGGYFVINGISYSESGQYIDWVINDMDCEEYINLNLTVLPNQTIILQETICEGATYLLGNQVFEETGNYNILLTSANGCDSLINLELFVETNEVTCTAFAGNDTLICSSQMTLYGLPTGGEWSALGDSIPGNISLVWMNNTMTEVAVLEIGEYRFAYTATSFDSLMIFDTNQQECVWIMDTCVQVDTVQIVFDFLPQNLTIETTADCWNKESGSIELVSSSSFSEEMLFSLDNENFKSQPFFDGLEEDDYLLYSLSINNCRDTFDFTIDEIEPLPEIDLEEEYQICGEAEGVLLNIDTLNHGFPIDVEWSNGDTTAISMYRQAGKHFVTISNTCEEKSAIFSIIDNLSEQLLLLPNTFTPNDDGANDIFGPIYNQTPDLLEFSVYSRWGERVFYTNDFNYLWDGRFNGQPMDSDVYIWILRAQIPNCLDDVSVFNLKGDVMLMR